jgi:hypothetical protein
MDSEGNIEHPVALKKATDEVELGAMKKIHTP